MQGLLDIEEQCRGFLDVAKAATALLVKSMFSDSAFLDLFNKLCCSDDWKQGTTTASILATLADYLADFKRMLEDAFFKRYLLSCVMTALPLSLTWLLFLLSPANLQVGMRHTQQMCLRAAHCYSLMYSLVVGPLFLSNGNEHKWSCCEFQHFEVSG